MYPLVMKLAPQTRHRHRAEAHPYDLLGRPASSWP